VACALQLAAGQTYRIAVDCASFTGDTMLRLFDATRAMVAYNDDAFNCGAFGQGSSITYTVPCRYGASSGWTLSQGCYGDDACTGTVGVSYEPGAFPTCVPPAGPVPSPVPSPSPSPSPSGGATEAEVRALREELAEARARLDALTPPFCEPPGCAGLRYTHAAGWEAACEPGYGGASCEELVG
jgi:hypothetical protein